MDDSEDDLDFILLKTELNKELHVFWKAMAFENNKNIKNHSVENEK